MSANDTASGGAILLHPDDNVLISVRPLAAGAELTIDGEPVSVTHELAVGHKIARRDMSVGVKVYRYGAPVGSLTADVRAGEWVHMHNMKSDYLAVHTRQSAQQE